MTECGFKGCTNQATDTVHVDVPEFYAIVNQTDVVAIGICDLHKRLLAGDLPPVSFP